MLFTDHVDSVCQQYQGMYTVSPKNVTTLSRHKCDINELILIIFGTNVTEKVQRQKVLYFPTSPN